MKVECSPRLVYVKRDEVRGFKDRSSEESTCKFVIQDFDDRKGYLTLKLHLFILVFH